MAVIAILILSVASVVSASVYSHKPKEKVKHDTSLNWAGYAVDTNVGSVTDVKGSWIVPAVSATSTQTYYSSFWVGIDGDISSTVEQIGTDCDFINGIPMYSAWYEFYPANPVTIKSMKISQGDTISAEVKYDQNRFTVYIKDVTTGDSFSASTSDVKKTNRNSAEWITEATSQRLANFDHVDFSSNYATIDGTQYNLGSIHEAYPDTMVTKSGISRATPTGLSPDGSGYFSVIWNHE